ncbi:flagellar biosynthetic protein FliO [Jeotgalibacillus haloalkalitolerans]|uniref:Flagellar biosynthetic protein FliO n=1 Tax=Jeotgalibacillus haloalkalitolerans TaxID=3104292 RepID=A0ABU5KKD4_9BACL|nr:flagellar biosynthetic protein FliO [Jeotgalibacillus sp. HH7-29]MDZ5711732.1 flagellar biosynthetic protein FliO [Jeotgalibacillus sp. HH7-29]
MIQKLFIVLLLLTAVTGGEQVLYASPGNVSDCMGDNPSEECAEQDVPAISDSGEPSGINFWTFVRLIGALAFVVILLYALLKFVNSKTKNFQQSRLIKNMGGTTLGGNRSVQIVKIADSYYILGVGEDVNLIKEINSPDEIEEIEEYFDQSESIQQSPVSGWVEKLKERKASVVNKEDQSFGSLFKEQLKEHQAQRMKMFEKAKGKERNKDG